MQNRLLKSLLPTGYHTISAPRDNTCIMCGDKRAHTGKFNIIIFTNEDNTIHSVRWQCETCAAAGKERE